MCYIVVAFWDGIGHILQGNNKLLWYFEYLPKYYAKVGFAITKARQIKAKHPNIQKVVVYRIDVTERFSCSDFCNWNDRIIFDTSKC